MAEKPKKTGEEERFEREFARRLDIFRHFVGECQSCQAMVSPHWQFCAACGTRLATQCPGCGNPLPPLGSRYCPHCGLEIPAEEGQPSPHKGE
ncbi:MAG: zinc ribbon domain-containing protein [Chloroflexi bacterium]|nr:zinc ribbon domain-containing protein [Chloroflexota bacterium]